MNSIDIRRRASRAYGLIRKFSVPSRRFSAKWPRTIAIGIRRVTGTQDISQLHRIAIRKITSVVIQLVRESLCSSPFLTCCMRGSRVRARFRSSLSSESTRGRGNARRWIHWGTSATSCPDDVCTSAFRAFPEQITSNQRFRSKRKS